MDLKLEMPGAVRDIAEMSIAQAERAFDAFIKVANKSATMMPNPIAEIPRRRCRPPNRILGPKWITCENWFMQETCEKDYDSRQNSCRLSLQQP